MNPESRKILLKKYSPGYFEHNMEQLLMSHEIAYLTTDTVNAVLPLIKASALHTIYSGML